MNPLHKEILGEALERAVGNTPVAAKHVMKLVKEFQQALKEHEAQIKEQGKTTKEIEAHAKELQKTIKTYDKILEQAGEALSQIKQLKQGDPGRDADEEAIVQKVLRAIPKPQDGKDGVTPAFEAIVSAILKRMPEQKPAKDGKSVKVEDVLKELKKSLTVKDIPGLENELAAQRSQLAGKIYGKDTWARGGGDTVAAGTNITITTNADGAKVINATGGAGVETVTGLNTDNTDPANPVVQISVDGVTITGAGTPGSPLVAVTGGSGDVTGPASSTDNAIVRFDGLTGKIIQGYTSGAPTISDTGAVNIPLTTGNSLVVDTSTFVVDATNNRVGILTASPTQTFAVDLGLEQVWGVDVDGVATFPHSLGSGFSVLRAPANRGFRFQTGTTTLVDFPTSPTSAIVFGYARMQIGDSSSPGSSIYLNSIGASDLNLRAGDGNVARTADVIISVKDNQEVARFTDTGNVGIGISTPALQSGGTGLHINGTTSSELKFTNSTTGTTATDGTALVSTGLGFTINNREAGALTLGTSNAVRVTIDSAGLVGIGITPSYKLDVESATNGTQARIGSSGANDAALLINTQAGQSRILRFTTGNLSRWAFSTDGTAEGGSNAGSDFSIARYSDAGGFVGFPLFIKRSTGNVGVGNTSPSALLTLGTAGTTAGTLSLAGGTSGVVTLQTAAAAGTYTLTLPTSDGDANQVLTTDGSGVLSWTTNGTGDVTKVGTPVNNQVGVWTGDGTLEGDTGLTFDTTTDTLTIGGLAVLGNLSSATITTASAAVPANIAMVAGNATSGDEDGGTLDFTAGNGSGINSGGGVIVTAGNGGATAGVGGSITLMAGTGGATNGFGGDIILQAGAKTGIGTVGYIKLYDPTSSFAAILDMATLSADRTFAFPDTSGTLALAGTVPTTITVANEATDTTCFPTFFTAATGDLGPKTNANLTYNSNTGAFGIGTSAALTAGTIELGAASDTTLSRSAAGVIAVEGVVIPSISSTNTLTNKRVTRRLTTTNAPGATPTTNTDNVDIMNFTGLNAAITSMTTNLSGTPVDGDLLEFRFLDDGTARAITWGASFAATTIALPTTTVISTCLRALFEWRAASSKWEIVATC